MKASLEPAPLQDTTGIETGIERGVLADSAATQVTRSPASIKARFARDVFIFGWANIVTLFLNGILSFLLPRYLTTEDFGYYRLFVLYASLAGLAHLGMLEGVLVRWAEKPEERVGREIKGAAAYVLLQHVVLLGSLCILLFWLGNHKWVWLEFSLASFILIFNFSVLGQIALQAPRRFKRLSFYTVLVAAMFLGLVLLCKVVNRLDAETAVGSFVVANLLGAIGIWKSSLRSLSGPKAGLWSLCKFGFENTRLGWKILVANLLITLNPSLDRFFVSARFSIRDFAIYAFAGNALAIVYTVAISSARVVYPYLSSGTSTESRRQMYELGRSSIFVLWAMSLILYFPVAYLVALVLPKYQASLPLMRLLLIASGLVAQIHVLHSNYFRVNLALDRFLAGSFIGVVAIGGLLALIGNRTSLTWVATSMILATAVWWIANEQLLAASSASSSFGWLASFAFWFLMSLAFIFCASIAELWLGVVIYAFACGCLIAMNMRKTVRFVIHQVSISSPRVAISD